MDVEIPEIEGSHRERRSGGPSVAAATSSPSRKNPCTAAVSAFSRVSGDDLEQGLAVVNAYAAEHLEIHTADADAVAGHVRSAGAVFVGPHSPVSLGDYCAGSNHVLPTGGCAAHSSGLSVQTFLRGIQVVSYSEIALHEVASHAISLSEAEDLPAHGRAVAIRFSD